MENVTSYLDVLLKRFAARGILVDTNLLLLYAIGKYDASIVERSSFDRLSAYDLGDLRLLQNLLSLFDQRATTPHVLTEVSNWIGYLSRDRKTACLAQFSEIFSSFVELHTDSLAISRHERFRYLGLTDTAIAQVAGDYLVVTDDLRFANHLSQMGLDALNINHLRQELWLRE